MITWLAPGPYPSQPPTTTTTSCSQGIFQHDNVNRGDVEKLVDAFPGQSIDFFGALRARVYDDKVGAASLGVLPACGCCQPVRAASLGVLPAWGCCRAVGAASLWVDVGMRGLPWWPAAGLPHKRVLWFSGRALPRPSRVFGGDRSVVMERCWKPAGSPLPALQVREWISGVGVENIGKKLVNSREGKVEFEKPSVSWGCSHSSGDASTRLGMQPRVCPG